MNREKDEEKGVRTEDDDDDTTELFLSLFAAAKNANKNGKGKVPKGKGGKCPSQVSVPAKPKPNQREGAFSKQNTDHSTP